MDFENAKENIQPLPRGRNIKALELALNAEQSHELQSELIQQRKEYELAISSYEGDDPLEPWFEYINWIEQCYPKSGNESALEKIISKCLTTFETDEKYHQDRRMIKLYIKYIDAQQNPIEYYQELYNQGVGTRVADLYICWAHYYDANDNFEQTESIFRKGFDAHAEPLDELKVAHKQFGFSMSQRILYKDDFSKQEFVSKMNERRFALTSLKAHKHKYVGSLRTGVAIKNEQPGKIIVKSGESKENCNNINLNVYEDEGAAGCESIMHPQHVSVVKSIIDSARKQENLREPGLWTKKSTKHNKIFSNEHPQEFDILEDSEEFIPIKSNNNLSGVVLPENFVRRNLMQPEWNVDIIIEEECEPFKIPMYNKVYLYKENMKKDYSMEHLRAYFWYKNNKQTNILTEEMDEHWSNNYSIGVRLPILFYRNNIPQDAFNPNRYTEPFKESSNVSIMTLYNEIYPVGDVKEYSLEEILAKRIKRGTKRINKPKCLVKNRVTQFVAVDMEETIIEKPDFKKAKRVNEEKDLCYLQYNAINPKNFIAISDNSDKLKEMNTFAKDDIFKSEKNIFVKKNDDFMLPPPAPPKIHDNFEKNAKFLNPNDSCDSTQTFNFFIQSAPISTPMKQRDTKHSLLQTDYHDNTQPQQSNNQQQTNDYKQLSVIMETTESNTISTGSSGASTGTQLKLQKEDSCFPSNRHEMVQNEETLSSMCPIKFFEDKIETASKTNMSIKSKKHTDEDFVLPFNLKSNEDTVPLKHPIQIFEDKTETIPKMCLLSQLKEQKEDSIMPSNRNENFPIEDTAPSMCPIKIFEDKTETVPKFSLVTQVKHQKEDSIMLSSRNGNFPNEDTAPSMCPIKIFEDKTETVPKFSLIAHPKQVNEDSIMPSSRNGKFPNEDTAPSMCPIKIFEDKTETVPKFSLIAQPKHQKDDSIMPSCRNGNFPNEDTAPSMCPIKIFEDKTETVPKFSLVKQLKEDSVMSSNRPSMCPIQIFEDKTETVPKFSLIAQPKQVNEDSIMPSSRNGKFPNEDTAPSMCPIKIFEDKTETVPKFSLIAQPKHQKDDSIMPSSRNGNFPNEDTAPSMCPIKIFEDKTETVPKFSLAKQLKEDSVMSSNRPSMCPIQIFEDKTETVPKFSLIAQPKHQKDDSIMPSCRNGNFPNEDTAPSMCPIQIFEDKTETVPKLFMSTKLNKGLDEDFALPSNHNGIVPKEDTFPSMRPIQIFEDKIEIVKKEDSILSKCPLKSENKDMSTCNTTNDNFFDIFTKTPTKNLGAIPKVKELSATPKIFEFVKCDKSRFTNFNNSLCIMDPLSSTVKEGCNNNQNLQQTSQNNSSSEKYQGRELCLSLSFTQNEINFNAIDSDNEDFDVSDEENLIGQSIYITKTAKIHKENELLKIRHDWEEIDDSFTESNNSYMHNEHTNLNITKQIIDNRLNDKKLLDPYDKNLIDAFLENIDFINYLSNLENCLLVNKLCPLKVGNSIEINKKKFVIQNIIGKGAYGTIFSGVCQQTGELYAFKQERPANLFEYYICLELHSRLTSLSFKKAFMNIEYSSIGNNASILISKLSKYGSLINVCNVIKEKTAHNIDEYIVMLLSSQLLLAIDHLHSCNIMHGDIKPDNILLMSPLVYGDYEPIFQFIDFGRGIDMQLFPEYTKFNIKLQTKNFICPEMMENRPWTYQHDLFCLASTVYVLLFGKYMSIEKNQTWKVKPNIPRYYNKSVWDNFFDKLLNIPSCEQLPNLQELRDNFKAEIVLKEKYIREKINHFNNAFINI